MAFHDTKKNIIIIVII